MVDDYEGNSTEVRKGSPYSKTVRGVRPSSESEACVVRRESRKLLIKPKLTAEEKIAFAKVPKDMQEIAVFWRNRTLSVVEGELADIAASCKFYFERENIERLMDMKRELERYRSNLDMYEKYKDLIIRGRNGGERPLIPKCVIGAIPDLRRTAGTLEAKLEADIKKLDGRSSSGERLYAKTPRQTPRPRCYGATENNLNSKEEA